MLQVSCLNIKKLPTITLNFGGKEFHISGRHYVQKVSTTMANYTVCVYLSFSCFLCFFFFNTMSYTSGKFAKQKGNLMVFTRVHTKSRLIFRKTVSAINRREIPVGRSFRCLTVDTISGQDVWRQKPS